MKVSVSSIREFEYCPRALYLRRVIRVEPSLTPERAGRLLKHAVRKELCMRQPELLGKTSREKNLHDIIKEEFERVLNDLPAAYGGRFLVLDIDAVIRDIRSEVEPELGLISSRLHSMVEQHGLERAVELITPVKVKCRMESEQLGLKGMVDKVMDPIVPVGIKTGRVGSGVWNADRLQLCAYGMLLEEHCETEVKHGMVEYTMVQEQRTVPFDDRLKTEVVAARDMVVEVLSGPMPELCPHGSGRKCEACGFREVCYRI